MPEAELANSDAALDAEFAAQIHDQVRSFLVAVREIAREGELSTAVPLLLLEVSQLMLAGGRLGAIDDILPKEQFETDTGADQDLDELRERFATVLEGLDEYAEVFDPYAAIPEVVAMRLSDDITDIAAALQHGDAHYVAGRVDEALWWWQFSYLSSWGNEAGAALRALQSIAAHSRVDR